MARAQTKPKGASYPFRQLAEHARESAGVWRAWAVNPARTGAMGYSALTLVHLYQVMAFVLDKMADVDLREEEPPPKSEFLKVPK